MASTSKTDVGLATLKAVVDSSNTMLARVEPVLRAMANDEKEKGKVTPAEPLEATADTKNPVPTPPFPFPHHKNQKLLDTDPLSLAYDAATLIRANATKLSLLLITEPFTPKEICKILLDIVVAPVPLLASAAHLCRPDGEEPGYSRQRYPVVTKQQLARQSLAVVSALKKMVEIVPLDGRCLSATSRIQGKISLPATGQVWSACDDVALLKDMGMAGILSVRVSRMLDMIKDQLEELEEWKGGGMSGHPYDDMGDEDDDGSNGDDHNTGVEYVTSSLETTHLDPQDMIDDLMTTRQIPADDPDKIRDRLDSCLQRLHLTMALFSQTIENRLKALPSSPDAVTASSTVVTRLDEIMPLLSALAFQFDDVAWAFYELDPKEIDDAMDKCFFDAFAVSEMLKRPWEADGHRDAFTEWVEKKFQPGIKMPPA